MHVPDHGAQVKRSFFGVSLPINFLLLLSALLWHKRQAASRNAPSIRKEFLPSRKAATREIGFGRSNRVLFVPAEKTTINTPLYGRQLRLSDGCENQDEIQKFKGDPLSEASRTLRDPRRRIQPAHLSFPVSGSGNSLK